MDEQLAYHLVESALDMLFTRDADLPVGVGERCIAHRIAIYIEERLRAIGEPWLSVDCEYNRMGNDPKRLKTLVGEETSSGGVRRGDAVPDIVVHRRGLHGPNIIAIEVKRDDSDLAYDEKKLRLYKKELGYQHALLILIPSEGGRCTIYREAVAASVPAPDLHTSTRSRASVHRVASKRSTSARTSTPSPPRGRRPRS